MGQGIETVLAYLSNAATATAQAMTPGTGQSFSIRAAASNTSPVTLEAMFTNFEDLGDFRVRSPRMHDATNGIRVEALNGVAECVANEAFMNTLYSQDTLTVESVFSIAPTAAHISQAALQVYYDDVPGISANYRSWAEVQPNIVQYLSVPVAPTSGATAGNWGNGVAINSSVDEYKANTLYALIGYVSQVTQGFFAIQGVDIGNLLVGGPIGNSVIDQRRYFAWMDRETGKPSIPVFNSQNKASTNVFAATTAASTAVEVSLVFAQLSA